MKTPKFWADCAKDGTIARLAGMMDTPIYGLKCSPTCTGGYTFIMDDVEYKKCKNMAFFHSLKEENYDAIKKLIRSELGE